MNPKPINSIVSVLESCCAEWRDKMGAERIYVRVGHKPSAWAELRCKTADWKRLPLPIAPTPFADWYQYFNDYFYNLVRVIAIQNGFEAYRVDLKNKAHLIEAPFNEFHLD